MVGVGGKEGTKRKGTRALQAASGAGVGEGDSHPVTGAGLEALRTGERCWRRRGRPFMQGEGWGRMEMGGKRGALETGARPVYSVIHTLNPSTRD